MALRRLREEIDAAFEAQRRPNTRKRDIVPSSEHLTPKWAEVTALLASVGRPGPKMTKINATECVSGTLRPVRGIFKAEKLQQLTTSERQIILRNCMDEWQRVAHAAAIITRLHIRARRRREQRLVKVIFMSWRQRVLYQLKLKTTVNFVKKKARFMNLVVVWTKWTCAQRRVVNLREFGQRRRRRLICEGFCAWVLAANQHVRYKRYLRKAEMQLLRCYWRWLKAGIETQKMTSFKVEYFVKQRVMNLMERYFLLWVDHIEQHKLWNFTVRWSDRRILGDTYDNWIEVHSYRRRTRQTLQLAIRRWRRQILISVLKVWNAHAKRLQKQKRALAVALHTQQRRNAFTRLIINVRCHQKRERLLLDWKIRRAVWTWLHSSSRYRMLRLRADFLRESHKRLILRTAVWHPWRRIYLRSVAMQKFLAKQRAKRLKKFWMTFVIAVNQQEQQRLMIESIVDMREVRALRRAIGEWRVQAISSREFKKLSERSSFFYRRMMLKNTMSHWKAAHNVVSRERSLHALAINHLVSKMMKHWAKWAYWSRRELGTKISTVKKRRRQRELQRCVDHWQRIINLRYRNLCSKYFKAWKLGIDMLQRQRHLVELRRVIQLRWRWQRWELFDLRYRDLRAKAHEVQKRHDERLLNYSFGSVWLCKARRYKLGSTVLKVLAYRHGLHCSLSRWKQNQQRLNALRLSSVFYRRKVQSHYLRLLFELTIGRKHIAIMYNRRRYLMRAWVSWNGYFTLRRRRQEAGMYFRRRTKKKAVLLLHAAAVSSITNRNQRFDAEAWHEAVLLQRVLSKWIAAAKKVCRCRSLGQPLAWNIVGRRAFRAWHDNWMEKQKLLKAAQFHSSVLVTRSWNVFLRVTRRRQVALVMWSHTMRRVCLAYVFTEWRHFVDGRRGQYAVAASICRMKEMQSLQKFFIAWALLLTTRKLALRFEQQDMLRWRQACWEHWKLWRVSYRWQRSQRLILLRNTFSQGLKRYAIQQQACREVYLRTARNLLHRSLAQWRVEWWLVCNQKKLSSKTTRNALTLWKTFVAACRQKRRWEHYVQQLHRSQPRMKGDNKRYAASTFRDTRALQAQLKRYRILMTHVLHAWYLVVQNRRRPRQKSKLPRSRSKARQSALDFWARRLMEKSFLSWRELSGLN